MLARTMARRGKEPKRARELEILWDLLDEKQRYWIGDYYTLKNSSDLCDAVSFDRRYATTDDLLEGLLKIAADLRVQLDAERRTIAIMKKEIEGLRARRPDEET